MTAVAPLMAQTGRVRLRVTDQSGAAIPRAEISLLSADGSVLRKLETNEAGEAVLTDLPAGDNRFSVAAQGFATEQTTATARTDRETWAVVALQLGVITMGEVAVIGKRKRRWWLF